MSEELKDIKSGIDTLLSKHGSVVKEISSIKTTVEVIKATCENRGNTCGAKVHSIDEALRGANNQNGLISRVKQLENDKNRNEKHYYILFGAIASAIISAIIAAFCVFLK